MYTGWHGRLVDKQMPETATSAPSFLSFLPAFFMHLCVGIQALRYFAEGSPASSLAALDLESYSCPIPGLVLVLAAVSLGISFIPK